MLLSRIPADSCKSLKDARLGIFFFFFSCLKSSRAASLSKWPHLEQSRSRSKLPYLWKIEKLQGKGEGIADLPQVIFRCDAMSLECENIYTICMAGNFKLSAD